MMSSVNQEQLLLTFDELLQLENADIAACVGIISALKICGNSTASPSKIYNLWMQKLLKAYHLEEFTTNDWEMIFEYLGNVIVEFVNEFNAEDDTSCKEMQQLWLDGHELLVWVATVIGTIDISVCSLIFTFLLEVIMRTYKLSSEKNFKALCNLPQLVVKLTNDFLSKLTIKDDIELRSFNKIASSLCEVGSLISSADIKTAIEIWRVVAKLSEKLYNLNKSFPFTKTKNSKRMESYWHEQAILGIFKELNKIIRFYNQDPCSSNDNLLQVAQLYLKILRLIINYSKRIINTFPALKEFIEIYAFCQHEMKINDNPKIELFINKPLFDIFPMIYQEDRMAEFVLQHLKYDEHNFKSCKLVFDYLETYIEDCIENASNSRLDLEVALKIYNCLVEGPLIFIDEVNYTKLSENFALITILDCTNEMHKKLCEYVIDSPWIRAYTSMDILSIYYSHILKAHKFDKDFKCFEYWSAVWNKLNKSTETYRQQKKLIEILLKTICKNMPDAKLQLYRSNKFENIEIISLMCGVQTETNLLYLNTNLAKNLKKMQERRMFGADYKELLNLLEICITRPQLINDFLKENLLVTLNDLLKLPASQVQKFQEFFNHCLRFFHSQNNQQTNQKLLKYLMDYEYQCCHMQSVFLVEFLLKQRPHSNKLLETLKTCNKHATSIINLIDNKPLINQTIDLKMFKNLPRSYLQSINQYTNLEQLKKKPRLDQGNFSNIKFILNDLNINAQKLAQFPHSQFDAKDFEILRTVNDTIEKCLRDC